MLHAAMADNMVARALAVEYGAGSTILGVTRGGRGAVARSWRLQGNGDRPVVLNRDLHVRREKAICKKKLGVGNVPLTSLGEGGGGVSHGSIQCLLNTERKMQYAVKWCKSEHS